MIPGLLGPINQLEELSDVLYQYGCGKHTINDLLLKLRYDIPRGRAGDDKDLALSISSALVGVINAVKAVRTGEVPLVAEELGGDKRFIKVGETIFLNARETPQDTYPHYGMFYDAPYTVEEVNVFHSEDFPCCVMAKAVQANEKGLRPQVFLNPSEIVHKED